MESRRSGQKGFVVSSELVIIATLVVIGMIVGMVAIRDAMTAEMGDVSEAFGAMDQSFFYEGINDLGTNAVIAGVSWGDTIDGAAGTGAGYQGQAGDEQGIDFNDGPYDNEDDF